MAAAAPEPDAPNRSSSLRYGEAAAHLRPMLEAFAPEDLVRGSKPGPRTFTGSSGRVFQSDETCRCCACCMSGGPGRVSASTRPGSVARRRRAPIADGGAIRSLRADATLLALGGASWPRLGSNGLWTDALAARGVQRTVCRPMPVSMSPERAFPVALRRPAVEDHRYPSRPREARGEAMITRYGVEGGAIYALSAACAPAFPTDDRSAPPSPMRRSRELTRAKRGDSFSHVAQGARPHAARDRPVAERPAAACAGGVAERQGRARSPSLREGRRAISSAGGVAWSASTTRSSSARFPASTSPARC